MFKMDRRVPQSPACPFFVMSKNKLYEPIDGEELMNIDGYEGRYLATGMGRIISLPNSKSRNNRDKTRVLSQFVSWNYYQVTLTDDNGKRSSKFVQILICTAFHENTENKKEVNHKDGDKLNNWANNLEWNTHPENVQHAYDTGLCKNIGETAATATISNKMALRIFNEMGTHKEISIKYKIPMTTVASIKTGINWSSVTGKKYKKKCVRLSAEQIIEIYNSSESRGEIVLRFKITKDHVGRIKRGKFHGEITKKVL